MDVLVTCACSTFPKRIICLPLSHAHRHLCVRFSSKERSSGGNFRVYEIPGLKPQEWTNYKKKKAPFLEIPPKTSKMKPGQDWVSVWPTAKTFSPSSVPLPIKQGRVNKLTENEGFVPDKEANLELMKIPNFLHLTPVHIKRHCQAIKKFCTEFPKNLELASKTHSTKLFPLEVVTSDYCFTSASIRDPRARKVTVKIKLSSLNLDDHAKDKMLRLVGERYNRNTDIITIETDRCPSKKQNLDYAMYLLTVLYHESKTVEPWEEDKTVEDMEQYFWNLNKSKDNIIRLVRNFKDSGLAERLQYIPDDTSENSLMAVPQIWRYSQCVENIMNKGESNKTLQAYKQSVLNLLNIKREIKQEGLGKDIGHGHGSMTEEHPDIIKSEEDKNIE